MLRYSLLLFVMLFSSAIQAVDLENGKHINRSCAMCHGQYGQGAPGPHSPRMAGIDKDYLVKATREYRDDERTEITMAYATGLKMMTDQDIEDVSAYLAQLEIPSEALIDVKTNKGNPVAGRSLYKECKGCHGADGMGKPKEKAPRLAGQFTDWLALSIEQFKTRERNHGMEEEDQLLFDEISPQDIEHILAYVATLDDAEYHLATKHKPRVTETEKLDAVATVEEKKPSQPTSQPETDESKIEPVQQSRGLQISDIRQTVAKLQLQQGLTPKDAEMAMLSKAADLNLKIVSEQHVSRELELRGKEVLYLKIYQFCDPEDAMKMIRHNPLYASYMPCRIAVVEDQQGTYWIMMLNLDMLIESKLIPPEVSEIAMRINHALLKIMVAGASGNF